MNKYDQGNSWNLDTDSWIDIILKSIGSILFLGCLFSIMYFALVMGSEILGTLPN